MSLPLFRKPLSASGGYGAFCFIFVKRNFDLKTTSSILVFVFLAVKALAGKFDSLSVQPKDSAIVMFFSQTDFSKYSAWDFNEKMFPFRKIDPGLTFFHHYLPVEARAGLSAPFLRLFYPVNEGIGFRSGLNTMNVFSFSDDWIKYYRTRAPYTEAFLVIGQGKEQSFQLVHTQNVNRQWNVAFNILRANADGIYLRQNMSSNNLAVSSNFVSKNNRYAFLANGIYSTFKKDENGGIENDSLFENNVFTNRKLIGVNLDDARVRTGERSFFMNHFLYFGEKQEIKRNDSVSVKRIMPKNYISYSFSVEDHWFVYSDKNPRSGFYNNVLQDSIETLDSTHVSSFQNSIALQHFGKKVHGKVSYTNNIHEVFNKYTGDSMIMNHIAGAEIFSTSPSFTFSLSGNYVVAGSNQGDYESKFLVTNMFYYQSNFFSVELSQSERSPEYIYNSYSSNNFLWYNNFGKIQETGAAFNVNLPGCEAIRLEYKNIYNYTYFDSTFLPKQNNEDLKVGGWKFQTKILKWKHFNFWGMAYGYGPLLKKDTAVLRDHIFLQSSAYYEGHWFKKTLLAQIGADVLFVSNSYPDSYMPALGMYYLQRGKEISNYPYIDFFFNLKIRYAKIFFKIENITAGLFGFGYYAAPHYPAYDRVFKFGISMKFWD